MTAITVFVIATSYSQTIDLFPTGGGGYLVATSLLGAYPGVVSGCALVVDYVLTVSISIASGADAIFSFLPISWLPWKLWMCALVVFLMVVMNLRGVKESVLSLLPIFIAFIIMHVPCNEVMHTFSRCVFFAGSLVFEDESEGLIERFLHNHTAYEIQRWLQIQGRSLVILPVCVSVDATAPSAASRKNAPPKVEDPHHPPSRRLTAS